MDSKQAEDQLYRFGGGAESSNITPVTLGLFCIAILLIFLVPRKYVIVPFALCVLFIPYGQVINLAGLHFQVYRMIIPFAWVRVLASAGGAGRRRFQFNGIDKAVIGWALTDAVCFTLLWSNFGALINRAGSLYNIFGIYFLLRVLISERDDVNRMIRVLAVSCSVFAIFMIREQLTGHNIFALLGGVSEFTAIREGRIRSQASFAHALLAGTIGAILFPIFMGLWCQAKSKVVAGVGMIAALIMVFTSNSATTWLGCLAGIGAFCMWTFRRQLRVLRWAGATALVGLHLVMKAPVWALIGRINLVGGNSGYHRYELINDAVIHFGHWWLLGEKNPSSWGWEMGDVSDAYVNAALSGGVFALILFVAIIWQSFKALGIARKIAENDRSLEIMIWALGSALFSTVVSYFGIWFFDQSVLIWYALLAMIGAITSTVLARAPVEEAAEPALPWARRPVPLGVPVGVSPGTRALGTGTRLEPSGFPASKAGYAGPYRRP